MASIEGMLPSKILALRDGQMIEYVYFNYFLIIYIVIITFYLYIEFLPVNLW